MTVIEKADWLNSTGAGRQSVCGDHRQIEYVPRSTDIFIKSLTLGLLLRAFSLFMMK